MVANEFFSLINRLNAIHNYGLEDMADKMSSIFSVLILSICVSIVTIKSYVIKPISCYLSTGPSGGNFQDYIENYCWIHGTIQLYPDQRLSDHHTGWDELEKTQKINYYQWVPFILGLQCIMFYIPKLIWQMFCFNQAGTNLDTILKLAMKMSEKPISERRAENENIARIIENMLVLHRDFRNNKIANIRRSVFSKCSLFMRSKRLGTMLVFSYFLTKLLYLTNGIGQLFMIQSILGFYNYLPTFGSHLFWYILSGTELETQNYFPRVVFCYLKRIRHVGAHNNYVAQCVLPVNMLNEKIYTFLWCWILLVAFVTFISIPLWINRLYRADVREHYIGNFLQMLNSYDEHKKPLIHKFINDFLRHDGLFLLRMISNNAGDLIAAYLVNHLWEIYLNKYQNRNLRKDIFSVSNQLKTDEANNSSSNSQNPFQGSPVMNYL